MFEFDILKLTSFGKEDFNFSHQEVFIILSSSKINIHLSFFVLINLQNHCLVLIIDFGIEYSLKASVNNLDLALKIGSVGTKKGNL